MPEDVAPAEVQDQPTDQPQAPEIPDQPTDGPESFTDSYNPDELPQEARGAYEAAYKRLQGDYTQKTQQLAEDRREAEQARELIAALGNPERAPEVLKAFGFDLEQEPDDDLFPADDPEDRIAKMEAEFAQYQQEHAAILQSAAQQEALAEQIEELEKSEGREFDTEEIKLLSELASSSANAQGIPDVKAAFGLLSGVYQKRQQEWLASKKAPRRPGSGSPASRTADLSKPQERRELMVQAAEEAMASAQ